MKKKRYSELDEEQVVPVWIFSVLFCDVFPNALEYVSCVCGSSRSEAGCYFTLDI